MTIQRPFKSFECFTNQKPIDHSRVSIKVIRGFEIFVPTLKNSEHRFLKFFKIICFKFIIDDLEGIKLVPKVVLVL